jgi:SSS family solute:Na+ symporter
MGRVDHSSLTGIGWVAISGYLILLIPSFIVSPGIVQKIYGARSERTVRLGVALNGLALLFFSFFPVILGMIASCAFPRLAHEDLALPTVIVEYLPLWIGALLLASLFSAEISSADAVLFMLSTSLSRDFYQRFVRSELSPKELLRISRRISFGAGTAAVLLAVVLPSVIAALSIFYGLLSVALFVPLVFGLYRRITVSQRAGVLIVGTSVALALVFALLTAGEGWGPMTPTALGILLSAAGFTLASRTRR